MHLHLTRYQHRRWISYMQNLTIRMRLVCTAVGATGGLGNRRISARIVILGAAWRAGRIVGMCIGGGSGGGVLSVSIVIGGVPTTRRGRYRRRQRA